MELQYLKYFASVAETLSFSDAAVRCRVSQPSLSAQIRIMEDRLGTQLFHRNKRMVALTKEGQALLPRVRKILLELDELSSAAKEMQEPLSGNFFVGVTPMIAQTKLLDRFALIQKESPSFRLSFIEEGGTPLVSALLASQLDLILIPYHDGLESARIAYCVSELIPVVVCAPKNSSGNLPFIKVNSVCGLREFMTESLETLGKEPTGSLQAAHLQMIKKWIELGLGWSILPENSLTPKERKSMRVEKPRALKSIRICAAMLKGQRSEQVLPRFVLSIGSDQGRPKR